MNDIIVWAEGLTVSYGPKKALSEVRFVLRRDDGIVGLFGPNGAGKSTALRTICGDIMRYGGELAVPLRADIAYLPDKPFLYGWLRARQCADLFHSRHADFRRDVFDHFLAGSNIADSAKVSSLSKGMSERLHLALIMARQPKLYVLDEPLGGVDPLTRDHLLDLIVSTRAMQAPVLLSTHLIQGVDRVFDRVLMISDGQVVAHDLAENLRVLGNGDLEAAYKRVMAGS